MSSQLEFTFTETRAASWAEKREKLRGQRGRIMAEFERLGDYGATIAEIAALVADGHSNRVCQAIQDLRVAGLIEATGERRAVVGGKPGVVMRVGRQ